MKQTLRQQLRDLSGTYHGKRLVKVAADWYKLYRKRGLSAREYIDFKFDEASESFRGSFLCLKEQRPLLDYLNPKKYYILARNKYLTHLAFAQAGIRKAPFYCLYDSEGRFDPSLDLASDCTGVRTVLERKAVKECVVKTTEDSHGEGVQVVRSVDFIPDDCVLHLSDGSRCSISDLLGSEPLLFEGLVRQTSQFAAFNPTSVNTVRFMTALYPDGEVRIIATFIKIGRAGKQVDNAGAGGNVDVCVDVETGRLENAILFEGWDKIRDVDVHPDSGVRLKGEVIENWAAIKEEVRGFQRAFPYCKVAGWDIAITDEGPVALEVNDFWDRTGQLFIRRGWRNEIRDCHAAWKKTGKTYLFGRKRR